MIEDFNQARWANKVIPKIEAAFRRAQQRVTNKKPPVKKPPSRKTPDKKTSGPQAGSAAPGASPQPRPQPDNTPKSPQVDFSLYGFPATGLPPPRPPMTPPAKPVAPNNERANANNAKAADTANAAHHPYNGLKRVRPHTLRYRG